MISVTPETDNNTMDDEKQSSLESKIENLTTTSKAIYIYL